MRPLPVAAKASLVVDPRVGDPDYHLALREFIDSQLLKAGNDLLIPLMNAIRLESLHETSPCISLAHNEERLP
jgi:hypothetical protein